MIDFFVPFVLILLAIAGIRTGLLIALTKRPLVMLVCALLTGVVYQALSLPMPPSDAFREGARFCLAMLAFLAAQQCRLSRLRQVSPGGFKLAIISPPLIFGLFASLAFVLVPGLGLEDAALAGALVMLGGAPAIGKPLLGAPVDERTRVAARVESAAVLTIALPFCLVLSGAITTGRADTGMWETALFADLMGFTLGGVLGLGAGRLSHLLPGGRPVAPFIVAAGSYFGALALGIDPVLAAAAAGIGYGEEAPLDAAVRTRLWRTGEALVNPFALLAFGFVIGPVAVGANFLILFMALLAITAVRATGRLLALAGTDLPSQDRTFLSWYNGAPGVPTALLLLIFMLEDQGLSETATALVGATVVAGIIATRLTSKVLTRRLVHQTAIARKRRYNPA